MTDPLRPSEPRPWMMRYLEQTLFPRLGLHPDGLRVSVPQFGVRSDLLLIRPDGSPPCVVRFHRRRGEAFRLLRAHNAVAEHNLPGPRIVSHDLTLRHRIRYGFSVLIEELLDGEHIADGRLDDAQRDALAEALSAFHRIESVRWGEPGRPGWRRFYGAMIHSKILNRIASLETFEPEFTRAERDRLIAFSRRMARRWRGLPPYSLTHDKINLGNVLFTPSGKVCLIDLLTLRFGAPGKDLAAALYYFCSSPEDENDFKRRYFARLDSRRREHFEEFEPLYRAWHHLGRWATKGRDHGKSVNAGRPGPAPVKRLAERAALWRWVERGEGMD